MGRLKETELRRIRKIELAINTNLFNICTVVSVVTMAMAVVQFVSRGAFPPPGINFFYIGILVLYSAHKEMLRWLEEKKTERQGEWFVYSWILLTLLLYIINFSCKNCFRYDKSGVYSDSIRETTIITLEVCAVFVFTRFSKILKITSERK